MKKIFPDGLFAAFDLGTHAIKAAIIERQGGKDRLISLDVENLKPLAEFPGENEYSLHQLQVLRMIRERLPLRECREIVALFHHRELQSKIMELPPGVQPGQIDTILGWEAKKLLSPNYRSEPFIHGFQLIHQSPPVAALIVCPQNLIEQYTNLFLEAGISLSGAYGEAFGAQALKRTVENPGLNALSLINVGHTSTHVQIFAAGELKFYRQIPSGANELSKPPSPNELEVFSQKIRFSFDYFRAITKLTQIDSLVFYGGGAAQPQFLDFARQYFSPSRIQALDVSSHLDISPVLPGLKEIPGIPDKHLDLLPYLPAIGALMAHMRDDSETINLLQRFQEQCREERLAELTRMLPVWIGIIGFLLIATFLGMARTSLRAQIENAAKEAMTAETMVSSTRVKAAKILAQQAGGLQALSSQEKSAIRPLLRDRFTMSEILGIAKKLCPKDLSLDEILVLPAEEVENLDLSPQTMETDTAGPALSPGMPLQPDSDGSAQTTALSGEGPQTLIARVTSQQQNLPEGLADEFLILTGSAQSMESVASFSQRLGERRLLRRFRFIRIGVPTVGKVSFLLKGELP